ncbi:MAG: hypothetical protein RML46_06920 [Anaerolineae bacterium]|nr:hypothetical protein [Anaerolineae bacterium]MDW8068625.1 hypothetical protein [Anaerolineae bacterium]
MGGGVGIEELLQRMESGREALTARMRAALEEHAFTNRALFPPRQLAEFARQEAESFLSFLRDPDEAMARERGRSLARQGLSHRSVLALTQALQEVGWESANPEVELWPPFQQTIGHYVRALLEGYMAAREESILEQQEKTRQALLRALQQRSE